MHIENTILIQQDTTNSDIYVYEQLITKILSSIPNFQTSCYLKLSIWNVNWYAERKWLICYTKHRKDSQLQNLQYSCGIP